MKIWQKSDIVFEKYVVIVQKVKVYISWFLVLLEVYRKDIERIQALLYPDPRRGWKTEKYKINIHKNTANNSKYNMFNHTQSLQ